MNQSSKAIHEKLDLLTFFWLLEDWHGFRLELKRLRNDSVEFGDIKLLNLVEWILFSEKANLATNGIQKIHITNCQNRKLLIKLLLVSIDKNLLKTKCITEEKFDCKLVHRIIEEVTELPSTNRLIELIEQTLTEGNKVESHAFNIQSVDDWFEAVEKGELILSGEELLQVEKLVRLLSRSIKEEKRLGIFIADQLMKRDFFEDADRIYTDVIGDSKINESLGIRLARAKRNIGELNSAIIILESSIENCGRHAQLLNMLARYYQENQDLVGAIKLVKEIIDEHQDYSMNLSFATFAADMLRKNSEYLAAFRHLNKSVQIARNNNREIPLTVKAMLAELEMNVAQKRDGFFEVSSVFYDTIYENSNSYAEEAWQSIYEPAWIEVCKFIRQGNISRVIDIGCGPGQFAEYFLENISNVDYLGLDFSEIAVRQAVKRCPSLRFSCEDVRNYVNDDSLSTAFVLLEILEHIDDDLGLIKLLPESANIIFSVPNFDSFGHVRFFKGKDQVLRNFKSVVDVIEIKEVNISKTSKIFVCNSLKKK